MSRQLSPDQKITLLSGRDTWSTNPFPEHNLPPLTMHDGPHGLRKPQGSGDNLGIGASRPATCFPTAVTLGSSWDRALLTAVGEALGRECRREGVALLLGPGLNIKRHPFCGRNFEYFSEDPLLAGELAAAFIRGVQSTGVGACPKHFAANNQESYRFVSNSLIDERTLREIYLTGFEIAVKKGQPQSIMAAYNLLNGSWCCENRRLLTHILRNEWSFDGIVISDWGAVNDPAFSISAGLDLEMPGNAGAYHSQIARALSDGCLEQQAVDDAAARMTRFISHAVKTGTLTPAPAEPGWQDKHHLLARRAAEESAVLLKNDNARLPLSPNLSLALIGRFAEEPRYQGNGSSLVNPTRLETLRTELTSRFPRLRFTDGTDPAAAEALAAEADAVIFCAGLPAAYESEGFDRHHLDLPADQNELIRRLHRANPNIIVVLNNGAPVTMPWAAEVPAILEAFLGGQAGASAVARLLCGEVNPCGKLAETFPLSADDVPSHLYFPGAPRQTEYREGLFVGYRFYDSARKAVLFPFGHGLSYTAYTYGVVTVEGEAPHLTISLPVTNSGPRDGKEIVQLYIHKPDSQILRPEQELKEFAKVALAAGETKTVRFTLTERAFAVYSPEARDWYCEPGGYEIRIAASSRDIRQKVRVILAEQSPGATPPKPVPESYREALFAGRPVSDDDFRALLGREIPRPEPLRHKRPFHLNSTLGEIKPGFIGGILYRKVLAVAIQVMEGKKDPFMKELIERHLQETPLRSLVQFSGGRINPRQLEGILNLLNGFYLKGIRQLLKPGKNPQ